MLTAFLSSATVILASVVSAQSFYNNDRRGYRTSNNLRRLNGNNGNGASDAATAQVTQMKESNGAGGAAYPTQVQTQLPDG